MQYQSSHVTGLVPQQNSIAMGMHGQISTGEEPASWVADIPALRSGERAQTQMPALDMQRIEAEDLLRKTAGEPFRFGYRHDVNFTLENSGEWK